MAEGRAETLRWGGITALGVVAGYLAVLLADVRHFYTDDSESQYVPVWVHVGRMLREGHFPTVDPEEWMNGNYPIEGAGSLFNPPQLLVSLAAPSFDNLLVLATIVKLGYAIILALGVFRTCLAYGAKPPFAAIAGVALPFSGFILFFDEAAWVLSLAGTAWIANAWASAVNYSRGRSGPLPAFVFLVLAITVGEVWPAVEAGVVMAAVAAGELIGQRRWQPSARLLVTSACAASVGLITYLPSLLSASVTWRKTASIVNDGFLTVPWSESLNASLPSTYPSFNSWFGIIQPFPIVYIAWFVIPALAFIDWSAAVGGSEHRSEERARSGASTAPPPSNTVMARSARDLSGIAIFTLIALFWTAGPAALGPLRWPARALPMLALGALVLTCVLLSRYGTLRSARGRICAAGVLIGLLLIRSVTAAPRQWVWHIGAAVLVVLLGAAVLWLFARRGAALACAAIVVSVVPIVYVQVERATPHPLAWNLPANRADARAAFPDFTGTTLQLSDRMLVPPEDRTPEGAYRSLTWGNFADDMELNYVNGYTPIGHKQFAYQLCMRWDGSTCPDALRWTLTVEPSTGKTFGDLMKIDRIVLQRAQYPGIDAAPPPPGWHWVAYPGHEQDIAVLERDGGPISTKNGRVAHTDGVTATSLEESDRASKVRVSSPNGGRIVFARLDWPGYTATLDGRDLPVTSVIGTFVAVDIPPGTTDADLELTFTPPGWHAGAGAAALGFAGLGVMVWLDVRSRRRRQDADLRQEHVAKLAEPQP